ncbi:hypothetical protein A2U01_0089341, partial [Trifolium medium]|nr:hypothetical protein [Trifolium medium]
GQGSVRAVLEGLDGAVSDSDLSERCKLDRPRERVVVSTSTGYNQVLGNYADKSGEGLGDGMVIPSTAEQEIGTADIRVLDTH